jgi:hypothetical protein
MSARDARKAEAFRYSVYSVVTITAALLLGVIYIL